MEYSKGLLSNEHKKYHLYNMIIKEADEPLNLLSVATALSFPGFFRTFIFRWLADEEKTIDSYFG